MSKKFPFEDVDEEYITEAQATIILGDAELSRCNVVPEEWYGTTEDMKVMCLMGIKFKEIDPEPALRLRKLERVRDEG